MGTGHPNLLCILDTGMHAVHEAHEKMSQLILQLILQLTCSQGLQLGECRTMHAFCSVYLCMTNCMTSRLQTIIGYTGHSGGWKSLDVVTSLNVVTGVPARGSQHDQLLGADMWLPVIRLLLQKLSSNCQTGSFLAARLTLQLRDPQRTAIGQKGMD